MISVPWGGSEELWSGTALKLRKEGFNIYINVKEWLETPDRLVQLEKAGCIVERRKFFIPPSLITRVKDRFIKADKRHNSSYSIENYLKSVKPDLVIVCQGSNQDGLDWMTICVKNNIQYISLTQAASEAFWPIDEQAEKMSVCYHNARKNFFVSLRNLKLTEKQIGESIANSQVVRNPFNVPYHTNLKWPDQDFLKLACVGRIQPDAKGQDILFEALADKKWKDRYLKVTLYGSGPNIRSLGKLLKYYSLENIVSFGGFTNNVTEIWEHNHGLALPSRYEGLPLAVVEAMLCGRICIVTDIAGNNEVIENNISGFIAEAPTAELYHIALENAWSNKDNFRKMGEIAKEKIKKIIPENPIQEFTEFIINLL